jgi:ATP-binding cassette subfamily F protein uup
LESFYKIAGQEAPPEEREMDFLIPPAPQAGNIAVELVNAGMSVGEGEQKRWLFKKLNLSLRPGQCTGIVGRNGVGKTSLLRLCLGQQVPSEGTATIGKRVVFNYIDQGRIQLNGAGTVMQEVSDSGGMVRFGDQTLTVRSYLRRFLFDESRVNERVDKLSGGERARLILAKVLCRGGNVIVLDEPTNDLDLSSLRMLEEALAVFGGTVLVVSHDRYFLDRICDQIVAFEEGGIHIQPGNFSYYLEKKKERQQYYKKFEYSAEPIKSSGAVQAQPARKLSYKEKQELETIEDVILDAEKKVAALESELNDPSLYSIRGADAANIAESLEKARRDVARLYERWEELSK